MMTELMLDTCKYDQCLCWLPADNVIPCIVTSMLPFGKTQKRKIAFTKTIRDPFTTQFTPVPRAKIAYLAASFRHIDACARGEIPIVAAPPPFPTRDSCLGAFRPPAVGVRGETVIPAAENLHNARSRCAPARCAGAGAERPAADREDSDGEVARSTRSADVLSACNA